MKARRPIRKQRSEKGIALLIAIFVLLLIGVMAIALIVSSRTETALAGNYRSSTNVYYAAVAGLEEARSRLRNNNPNSFLNTAPAKFLPTPGTPFGTCNPSYVINQLPGDPVVPWDPANPYFDSEFSQEFPVDCGGAPPPSPSPSTSSVWNSGPLNGLGFPGPMYKWVRINGISEQSLNLDTYPNYDGIKTTDLIYYDSTNHLTDVATGNPQVLEITALAVLPNGSQNNRTQKLVQYLVAPLVVNLPNFPAALTLLTKSSGNDIQTFSASPNASVNVRGIDQDTFGTCTLGASVAAIGVFDSQDKSTVNSGIPAGVASHYTGSGVPGPNSPPNPPNPGPDVQIVGGSFPSSLQSPTGLQVLVQSITQNADVTISGPANGSSLPAAMYTPSPTPMTVVVQGDLDLTGWGQTGYGLLLVTGNFKYDPSASWRGIILVIGQGTVIGTGSGGGDFDGAVLVANTSAGGSNLGKVIMDYGGITNGEGIHYSSCWVQAAQPVGFYKILSFHEMAQ